MLTDVQSSHGREIEGEEVYLIYPWGMIVVKLDHD